MPTYQVWAKDRYGRHEILTVLNKAGRPEQQWSDPVAALCAARRYVYDKNCKTPMTFDEQQRGVEYLVFEPQNAIYAGALVHGKQKAIYKTASTSQGDRWEELELPEGTVGQFYVGVNPKQEEWFFTDVRKRPVTNLKHELIEDKTLVFVHEQK